jgi:hypothetical protein
VRDRDWHDIRNSVGTYRGSVVARTFEIKDWNNPMNSHLRPMVQPQGLRGRPKLEYLPQPEEIRAMCLLIQDEWSDRERMSRVAGSIVDGERLLQWAVHEVRWIPPASLPAG